MLLVAAEILPYYAQVALLDASVPDYPDWGTGEQRAAWSPTGVAVGTRPDTDGAVTVELWQPPGMPPLDDVVLLDEGTVTIESGVIEIGSVTGADLHEARVRPGSYTVSVWGWPEVEPIRLRFVINAV